MKTLIVAALALLSLSPAARAESFVCSFTEPFFTLTYDTTSRKLVVSDDVMNKVKTYRETEFKIMPKGNFALVSPKGALLLSMKLTHEGSDGMGPTIYAYEATTKLIGGANNGEGGCSSSMLPNRMGEP